MRIVACLLSPNLAGLELQRSLHVIVVCMCNKIFIFEYKTPGANYQLGEVWSVLGLLEGIGGEKYRT